MPVTGPGKRDWRDDAVDQGLSAPLHLEPDSRSNRETDILFGEAVTIHEIAAGFSRVTLKTDGYPGWVETAALGEALAPDHVVCTPGIDDSQPRYQEQQHRLVADGGAGQRQPCCPRGDGNPRP